MTESVVGFIETGFDLAIIVTLLSSILTLNTSMVNVNMAQAENTAVTERLAEYRQHNDYDGTTVYPQDIVSLIFKCRGTPTVYVTSSKGTPIWSTAQDASWYNAGLINSLIDQNVMYSATLVKSGNGEVIGYDFRAK